MFVSESASCDLTETVMLIKTQQLNFLDIYAVALMDFSQGGFENSGRGAVVTKWPDDGAGDWVYLTPDELRRLLDHIGFTPASMEEREEMTQTFRDYDPIYEMIVVFLNEIEGRANVHQVRFCPMMDDFGDQSFMPLAQNVTNH
jgi:hypothetical protein